MSETGAGDGNIGARSDIGTDYRTIERHFTVTRAQLDDHLNARYSPASLIKLLDSQLPNLYTQDGGVWEGYTIADHTAMVLHQFERYCAPYPLPGAIDTGLFRLFLALHDIGKPIAIAIAPEGKRGQHRYTWELIEKFYRYVGIDGAFTAISRTLLHDDPIGGYLRGRHSKAESEEIIRYQARTAALPIDRYFQLLQIYYKVDAGSYTADAGGKPSLDGLFDFDRATPELRFAPGIQQQIDLLTP